MVAKAGNSARVDEMLTAVREFLNEHDIWANDTRAPEQPSVAFENALRNAVTIVLNGDIPARCQELWVQIGRLAEEWNQYAQDARDRKGRPLPRFWAAFTSMRDAFEKSLRSAPKRMEPVSALLAQRVSYEQIAFHIYGYRGKGPFVTVAGQPDIAKIHQEAEKPGSVVDPEWIHPLQMQMASDEIVRSEHTLANVRTAAGDETKRQNIDPASIEQLLREGQFPDVIAKVKAVSLSQVLAEAGRLGITPNERPNFGGGDLKEDTVEYEDQPPTPTPAIAQNPERQIQPIEVVHPVDDSDARIITLSATMGAGEIVAAMKAEGVTVTAQKVGAVLREHRKRSAETAGA